MYVCMFVCMYLCVCMWNILYNKWKWLSIIDMVKTLAINEWVSHLVYYLIYSYFHAETFIHTYNYICGLLYKEDPRPAVYPAPSSSNTSQQASADMDTHSTNIDTDLHDSNDALTPQSGQTNWLDGDTNIQLSIRLCLYNCRSLISKLIDFQNFVYSSNYNLIGLTETWVDSIKLDNEILPKGYTIYCRDKCTRGGRVLITIEGSVSSQKIRPLIVMGDFNVPDINWNTLSGSTTFSNQLCDLGVSI